MSIYLFRRTLQSLLVLVSVTLIVFVILHASGDPVELLMPPEANQEHLDAMRRTLGLDKPLWVQYGLFLKNALQGNLGVSYHHGQPAARLVLERLPASMELVFVAFSISLILSIPLGVMAATRRGKAFDRITLL